MSTTTPNFGWVVPTSSDLVKNGAVAIETLGDSIDASMVDLKGGTTGQVLSKTSNTDMDFTWTTASGGANYAAGVNKIINGDFFVNQRNFSSVTSSQYGFDRWNYIVGGGTTTYSAQTFTVGTAPVSGYEGKNFARLAATGQSAAGDYVALQQRIESVRTFAGQTATVSFWAKASAGTPSIGITLEQNFGSGGSATVTTSSAAFAITTSWVRYSKTITVPSISGKTVGTSDFLACMIFQSTGATLVALGYPNTGIQNATIDYWGVQVESGSTASPFQTATGTIQGELAACQRYYFKAITYQTGFPASTTDTNRRAWLQFPVMMRTTPASYSATADAGTVTSDQGTNMGFRAYTALGNTTSVAYFGTVEASAEL